MKRLKKSIAGTLVAGALAAILGCETSTEENIPKPQQDLNNVQIYAAWPEEGSSGYSTSRGNTDYGFVWHLGCGQRADYSTTLAPNSVYNVNVRYSNDGGSERVNIFSEGSRFFEGFNTQNTRTGGMASGEGWNNFFVSPSFEFSTGEASNYTVSITANHAEDKYGVDIDKISLIRK